MHCSGCGQLLKTALVTFAALIAVVALAQTQTKMADPIVLGIRLADTLSTPECRRFKSGKEYRYMGDDPDVCYKLRMSAPSKVSTPRVATAPIDLVFPFGKQPPILNGSIVTVQIVEGKVEWIAIPTQGLRTQEQVLAALREKYGEPFSLTAVATQNGFGAQFSSILAIWKFDNIDVSFFGIYDQADSGLVTIGTKKGTEFRTAMFQQKGPKL